MRRLTAALLPLAIGLVLETGCKSSRRHRAQVVEEESGELLSSFGMSNPKAAVQLVKGFHEAEGLWRWTQGKFSMALKSPKDAAAKGGVLTLQITAPEVTVSRLQSLDLACSIGGTALAPETFASPGKST